MSCLSWQYVAPFLRGKLEMNTQIALLLLSWQLQKTKSGPCREWDVIINVVLLYHVSLLPSLHIKNVMADIMLSSVDTGFEILSSWVNARASWLCSCNQTPSQNVSPFLYCVSPLLSTAYLPLVIKLEKPNIFTQACGTIRIRVFYTDDCVKHDCGRNMKWYRASTC